jgi:Fe-S-cluster containining protein
MPVFLECQRCTACCRWPGQVLLIDEEISRLAAFKGMSERDFIQQFAKLRPDHRGLALKEKPDGACVFLEGENCAVQPVKPQKCREFPNLWNFPGFEKVCQAIPREVGEAEFQRRIDLIKSTGNDRDAN